MSSVVAAGMGAGVAIGAWIAPTNPATAADALVRQALVAGAAAGSFHYVERSTTSGLPDVITGDAGARNGRQEITERGRDGNDVFNLRLVAGTVYFEGNTPAVVDQLGVPAPGAQQDTGRWVSIRRSDAVYRSFADGIATKSNLSQLPATFVARSASDAGVPPAITRIVGGMEAGGGEPPVGVATLDISSTTSLPRTFTAHSRDLTSGVSVSLSWHFGHWHERVTVAAPTRAAPYSSLGATPPPATG